MLKFCYLISILECLHVRKTFRMNSNKEKAHSYNYTTYSIKAPNALSVQCSCTHLYQMEFPRHLLCTATNVSL